LISICYRAARDNFLFGMDYADKLIKPLKIYYMKKYLFFVSMISHESVGIAIYL